MPTKKKPKKTSKTASRTRPTALAAAGGRKRARQEDEHRKKTLEIFLTTSPTLGQHSKFLRRLWPAKFAPKLIPPRPAKCTTWLGVLRLRRKRAKAGQGLWHKRDVITLDRPPEVDLRRLAVAAEEPQTEFQRLTQARVAHAGVYDDTEWPAGDGAVLGRWNGWTEKDMRRSRLIGHPKVLITDDPGVLAILNEHRRGM